MLLNLSWCVIDAQWRLVPKSEKFLVVGPASAFWLKLHVEVVDNARKYKAQLDERKTEN